MYTAWTCIFFGAALVVNSRWLVILWPLLLALVHRTERAESQLEKRLGDDYRAYKKQIRCYL